MNIDNLILKYSLTLNIGFILLYSWFRGQSVLEGLGRSQKFGFLKNWMTTKSLWGTILLSWLCSRHTVALFTPGISMLAWTDTRRIWPHCFITGLVQKWKMYCLLSQYFHYLWNTIEDIFIEYKISVPSMTVHATTISKTSHRDLIHTYHAV